MHLVISKSKSRRCYAPIKGTPHLYGDERGQGGDLSRSTCTSPVPWGQFLMYFAPYLPHPYITLVFSQKDKTKKETTTMYDILDNSGVTDIQTPWNHPKHPPQSIQYSPSHLHISPHTCHSSTPLLQSIECHVMLMNLICEEAPLKLLLD